MLCILGFLLPTDAERKLHNSWGAHSFGWRLLLSLRAELWIVKPENVQYLPRGIWCSYLALHYHLFRNVKFYFINQGVFFFLLPLPVFITIILRMSPGADGHQTTITSLPVQQCTFLCVRIPQGMFCMHAAHLGKYLELADLLGIEFYFLSHGNHQFLLSANGCLSSEDTFLMEK